MAIDMTIVEEAATLIASARQTQVLIDSLPVACRPRTIEEAHAIQDTVAIRLGAKIGGFKASAPIAPDNSQNQNEVPAPEKPDLQWFLTQKVRAPIFDSTIHASPCVISSREMPHCGVEAEIAFRFLRDLPPRDAPYTREEIADVTDAYAAVEVVSSRFVAPEKVSYLERLADCIINSGFVYGNKRSDWQQLHLAELRVTLVVNGETVVDQVGGHPTGDPFASVVALVEMMRTTVGVRAGQFVTCGSYTGLRYFKPGDVCEISFEGFGTAQLTFSP